MKRSLKSIVLIALAVLTSYLGFSQTNDPAEIVRQSDMPKDYVISEIKSKSTDNILLKAGNDRFGFSHILKRHSDRYSKSKDKGILFPKGTTGKQIIKGIKKVYLSGEHSLSKNGDKKIYWHELTMNGEKGRYRLVLNNDNEIITFYKLKRS